MARYAMVLVTLILIGAFLGFVARSSMLAAEILFGIFVLIGVVGFLGGSFRVRTPWYEAEDR